MDAARIAGDYLALSVATAPLTTACVLHKGCPRSIPIEEPTPSWHADIFIGRERGMIDDLLKKVKRKRYNVVELLAELLRFCQKNAVTIRQFRRDLHCPKHAATDSAEHVLLMDWLKDMIGPATEFQKVHMDIFRTRLEYLFEKFKSTSGNESVAAILAARCMAKAMDSALWSNFFAVFQEKKRIRLRPGAPFFIPDVKKWIEIFPGHRLSTKPENRGGRYAETEHIALLSLGANEYGHEVYIEVIPDDFLNEKSLNHESKFGVGVLCQPLVWPDDNPDTFFGVHPKEEDEQWMSIQEVLQAAGEGKGHILIFPELTFTPNLVLKTEEWLVANRDKHHLAIVVCGSAHEQITRDPMRGTPERVNVSSIFLCSTDTTKRPRKAAHYKFNSYITRSNKIEDISTPSVISLYVGRRWSFSVLICKDFLEDPVAEVLGNLRANLILIPALSEKIEPFRVLVEKLSAHWQAIVLVANLTSSDGTPSIALVGRPLAHTPIEQIALVDKPPLLLRGIQPS